MRPESVAPQAGPESDLGMRFCASLQPLPSVLRYYDEFADTTRSIQSPSEINSFEIHFHGRVLRVDLCHRHPQCGLILKHVIALMIEQGLAASTMGSYFSSVRHFLDEDIFTLLRTGPREIGQVWAEWRSCESSMARFIFAKHVLHLFCTYRWNEWSSDYRSFLISTLPLPAIDKFAGVRSGDVFLSAEEEARIVRYLDEISRDVKGANKPPYSIVADAGMLICAYQFGMRPVQIGMLDSKHVRIWWDGIDSEPSVHLSFHMAKQRKKGPRILLTRRVKREWSCIFLQLQTALDRPDPLATPRFFPIFSANEVSRRIASLTRHLIGIDDVGCATDLRHTAAQRLVDAGASHEELAEFLGHAHTHTGMVYFATSASHAERVNRALGASALYRQVSKIAHDRFISPEELATLKEDQQIAAVPHGTPISGIGGCKAGQPACPYNPITSCYGCRKFMPTKDVSLHRQVLTDMREVVLLFERSSRADAKSPAYLQLQRTIAEIQSVIGELDGSGK